VSVLREAASAYVRSVVVRLDSTGAEHDIQRVTADFEPSPGVFVSRTQFPLTLAYCITIHKVRSSV
jgi:ATP-dependent exoDNAse (exonuclease V) alpha subunit